MRHAVTLWTLLLLLLVGSDAWANAARPWDPGDPLSEPVARIDQAEILHESLAIDARAFATGGNAKITATYRILSRVPLDVPLVFVSPGIEQGTVELDGKPLAMEVAAVDALPESWRSPDTTPDGIRGHLQYADPIERVLSFRAILKPGEHELVVRYDARPTVQHGRTLVGMQLAYVLAPARDWARFGKLDVEVLTPEGWTLSSEPALSGDGAVYRRSFEGLPADALSMTLRPPTPLLREAIPWLAFVLALLASAIAGYRAGGRLVRFDGCMPALVGTIAAGAVGAALVMGAWHVGLVLMEATLPSQLVSRDTDYGRVAIAALGLLLGFVVAGGTTLYGRQRANKMM